MGNRRAESGRTQSRRNRVVGLLLTLLPGLMFVGLLAPAAVHVKPVAQTVAQSVPVTFENFRYAKRPLVSRKPSELAAGLAEASGIGVFFSGARYLAQKAQQAFQLPRFLTQEEENQIILDDQNNGVDDYVADQILEEPKEPQLTVNLTPIWNPELFDIIPPMLSRWGADQFDDLVGGPPFYVAPPPTPPVVVPEPRTALLLAMGLLALGARRPSRR
jgi:hypothetical protein